MDVPPPALRGARKIDYIGSRYVTTGTELLILIGDVPPPRNPNAAAAGINCGAARARARDADGTQLGCESSKRPPRHRSERTRLRTTCRSRINTGRPAGGRGGCKFPGAVLPFIGRSSALNIHRP
ncbi:hypothetical protein EVAR_49515_1 [Eumeta japonica]|uniref:Uncharacterized protein n=1 Tax=Eumeta variegata TaxID=151549 RepID=A0A4C1VYW7_EUMVA|nr:hypothetical protein EVAR_49515_1 [Eumeta japonica]